MKLSVIVNQLSNGELRNVNLGGNLQKGVTPYNYPEIISHINMGLLDLYTRFPLKLREVFVQQFAEVQFYKISSNYAISNTASTYTPKYVIDSVYNKFDDRLLKIDTVFDECGKELPLDDDNEENSLYLTAMDTIQIPCPNPNNAITVIYRAAHAELGSDGDNVLEQEVELPLMLVQPLLLFVAHRVHGSMNFIDSAQETMKYLKMYEEACARSMNQGAGLNTGSTNNKLEQNGWV